ncbi:MAG: DUF2029 domain-containing protein [Clostridiales bacterium]|nr:DUF2029 domain-containing protein [Clostridiales bacterium]
MNEDSKLSSFIFCSISIIAIVYSFILALLTNGVSLNSLVFGDRPDFFMDFYNVLDFARNPDTYATGTTYPPLSLIMMDIFARLIPGGMSIPAPLLRYTGYGIIFYFIYYTTSVLCISVILYKIKKGTKTEKLIFTLCCVVSYPFLITLDRGNILLIAAFFSLFFMAYYNSEFKLLRELSYLSLGISFAFKLYPAILGILLLKNKDLKGAVKSAVYGLILLFVPFFYFKGLSDIPVFFRNVFSWTGDVGKSYEHIRNSFTVSYKTLFSVFGILNNGAVFAATRYLSYATSLLALIASFFVAPYKSAALLSLLSCFAIDMGGDYFLVFMSLAAVQIIDNFNKKKPADILLLISLILLFPMFSTPKALMIHIGYGVKINLVSLLCRIGVLLMTLTLTVEGFIEMAKKIKNKRDYLKLKKQSAFLENPDI